MEVSTTMMNRRTAIKHLGGAASALLLTETLRAETLTADALAAGQAPAAAPAAAPTGPFTLPALPYAYDALEPSFDTATMHLHHDKHHQADVTNSERRRRRPPGACGQVPQRPRCQLGNAPRSCPGRRPEQRWRPRQPLLLVAHSGQGRCGPDRRAGQGHRCQVRLAFCLPEKSDGRRHARFRQWLGLAGRSCPTARSPSRARRTRTAR